MAIILLLIAFIAYVGLYFLWQSAQPYAAAAPPPVAQTLMESLLMPHSTIFLVMRGIILVMIFYFVADALMSWGKRRRIRRRAESERAAPTILDAASDFSFRFVERFALGDGCVRGDEAWSRTHFSRRHFFDCPACRRR